MIVEDDKETNDSGLSPNNPPASVSRRALLRRGAVAMPAILTLQSGAALARSSNLVSAAPRGTTDRLGRTLCLDTNSVYPAGRRPGVYDMGPDRHAVVNILRDQKYLVKNPNQHSQDWLGDDGDWDEDYQSMSQGSFGEHDRDSGYFDADYVCHKGGKYWVKPKHGGYYRVVDLPTNGVVLSTGSILSMSDGMSGHLV